MLGRIAVDLFCIIWALVAGYLRHKLDKEKRINAILENNLFQAYKALISDDKKTLDEFMFWIKTNTNVEEIMDNINKGEKHDRIYFE